MMRFRLRTLLILLAIGPPVLALRSWRQREDQACIRATLLDDAVKMYHLHTGELPTDLNALFTPPASLAYPQHWAEPYLESRVLLVDPWNNAYRYKVVDEKQVDFLIWSNGPDRQTPSADDIFAVK